MLQEAFEALEMAELPPISMELRMLAAYLCSSKSATAEICKQIVHNSIEMFAGRSKHINEVFIRISMLAFNRDTML